MNSQQVHQIVKLSETYGPAIAQQALQRVRPPSCFFPQEAFFLDTLECMLS